jgi:hypothetical protein
MSSEADENRTFEKFSADMWPTFKGNRNKLGYLGDAYYKTKKEDDHARASGAFYAYQRVGDELNRVQVKYRSGQALVPYLTTWELLHSTLFPGSNRTAEPVVDKNYTLVAHCGWFWASEILIPKGIRPRPLHTQLEAGVPAFADKLNPMPGHYQTASIGTPESKHFVLVNPEGEVLGVLASSTSAGAISTTQPWEYIMMGKALIVLAKGGLRLMATTLVRRGAKKLPATGPTVRAAEKALLEEEKQAAKAEAEAARKTLRGVGIAARTPFRRLVGRLSPAQMVKYLRDLLANRPDLRRLMAARTTTGMHRLETIKLALKEFEQTQGWKVVEKTAAQMEAVTTKNNLVTLRAEIKEVWINTERANRWDPDVFYDHVVHDLSAHALAGRGGVLGPNALPFVGHDFTAGITDGLTLLEQSITRGNVDWIVQTFGRR